MQLKNKSNFRNKTTNSVKIFLLIHFFILTELISYH